MRTFLKLKQRSIQKLKSQVKISEDFPILYLQGSESANIKIEASNGFSFYGLKDLTSFDHEMEEASI
jgi:hypothetical protein